MKTKTINKIINKKFEEWLASIGDEIVRDVVRKNSILTGGSIASMLLGEPVNDFDFYFKTKDAAAIVASYYVKKFMENPPPSFNKAGLKLRMWVETMEDRVKIIVKSAGVVGEESEEQPAYQYFEQQEPEAAEEYAEKVLEAKKEKEEKPDYRPVFLSSNAISLSGNVQLIIRFYGTPEQIHENYDYVHATNYWTSWEEKVTLRTEALECLITKELRYIGSRYPICSLIRARKFIQRDWSINAGQYLKIAMQINDLQLKDYNVLEEQLVGMDVAYFMQVLAALKEKDPTKLNSTYLVEIIDRIFG